ncbi:putative DUF805 domain-containing protein [Azospirillaceae bacterium]
MATASAQKGSKGKAAPKKGRGKKKDNGNIFLMVIVLMMAPLAMAFVGSALVIIIGIIPTVVATILDRSETRTAMVTVGSLNIAAMLPFMIRLWLRDNSLSGAIHIAIDPLFWLISYGAAGLGWFLHSSVPPTIVNLQMMRIEARIRSLRDRQVALIKEWGPEVAGEREEELLAVEALMSEQGEPIEPRSSDSES